MLYTSPARCVPFADPHTLPGSDGNLKYALIRLLRLCIPHCFFKPIAISVTTISQSNEDRGAINVLLMVLENLLDLGNRHSVRQMSRGLSAH